MSTADSAHATTRPDDNSDRWSGFFARNLPRAAILGPTLLLAGTLFMAAGVQLLPGDLDWISEPESMLSMFAAPLLFATWIVVGRTIARVAPRTGIVVTILGTLGAAGWAYPMTIRLFTADLVLNDFDPNALNDAMEGEITVYSLLAWALMTMMNFVVALTAGIALLRTRVAPVWTGVLLIAFVPLLFAAQAASVATEVTYPLAAVCLLAGVTGVVRSSYDPR